MLKLEPKEIHKKIPAYVSVVADELVKNGFQAYLVGGSLRDLVIGRVPTDYDIATNAKPDEVEKIFPKSISTNAKFGTVIVLSPDENGENFSVEVTTYRSEEDYMGGRWPSKVEFTTSIQDDLGRRDFTINAMAFNMSKSETNAQVIDLFGGVSDLKAKIIKAVGDPVARFTEDGLRGFRACRLASQLGFMIESKTFDAIKQTLDTAKQVSQERVRDEFLRLLMGSPKPSVGLSLLKESGLLKLFIPELLEGVDVTQPEYHVDDVFEHALKAVDIAEDSIKVAALFHDIGKPRTVSKDGEATHFYGHDVVGSEMTREILTRMKFPKAEIERIVKLIRWHMFYYPSADWRLEEEVKKNPISSKVTNEMLASRNEGILKKRRGETFKEGWTDSAIRRFIKNAGGEEAIEDLMKLRIADANANPKSSFHPEEIEALENRIAEVREKEMAIKISDLDVSGEDLEQIGVEKGPKMGEILAKLLDEVIEDPALNRKQTLLELVRSKYLG